MFNIPKKKVNINVMNTQNCITPNKAEKRPYIQYKEPNATQSNPSFSMQDNNDISLSDLSTVNTEELSNLLFMAAESAATNQGPLNNSSGPVLAISHLTSNSAPALPIAEASVINSGHPDGNIPQ